jgi:uncharacterized membrane protein
MVYFAIDVIKSFYNLLFFRKYLSPHFSDIFKNHVAVTIKGSHTSKQLLVVSTINQHLDKEKKKERKKERKKNKIQS